MLVQWTLGLGPPVITEHLEDFSVLTRLLYGLAGNVNFLHYLY